MGHSEKNPGVAAALSFVIPGLGQVYCERIFRGVVVLVATTLFGILAFAIAAYRGHQQSRVSFLQNEAIWQLESAVRWQRMALTWKRMSDSPASREGLADSQEKSAECKRRSDEAERSARDIVRIPAIAVLFLFLLPLVCWALNIFDAARGARLYNLAPSMKPQQVLPSPPLPNKKEWPWEGDMPTLR
ncbi:MAG: DUF5683 domain-containing protein [Thermoguttaceae bacterium]|jgi:TM2 domain-containing membrane protein YozV